MRIHARPVVELLAVLSALGGCASPQVRNWEQLEILRGQPSDRQADLLVQMLHDTPPEWHEGYREARPALVKAALERGHLEALRRILQKQEADYPIFGTVAFELARLGDEWTFEFLMGITPPSEKLDSKKAFNHDGIRVDAVCALGSFLLVEARRDLVGSRLIHILRTDPSPDVRISCTRLLVNYRSPQTIDALQEASTDAGHPSLPNNYRLLYTVGDSAREVLRSFGVKPTNPPPP